MNPKKENKEKSFRHPKLHLEWLCVTIIVPLLVVILPPILSSATIDIKTRIIIGLSLAVVLLSLYCVSLAVGRYEEAFEFQTLKVEARYQKEFLHELEDKMNELKTRLSAIPVPDDSVLEDLREQMSKDRLSLDVFETRLNIIASMFEEIETLTQSGLPSEEIVEKITGVIAKLKV